MKAHTEAGLECKTFWASRTLVVELVSPWWANGARLEIRRWRSDGNHRVKRIGIPQWLYDIF